MPKFEIGLCRSYLKVTLNGLGGNSGFYCELKKGHNGLHRNSVPKWEFDVGIFKTPKEFKSLELIEWESELKESE